jgi:oligopeptide transport system permease protein
VTDVTVPERAPAETVAAGAAGAPIAQAGLWRDAWRRYVRNRGAVLAAGVFLVIVLYCFVVPGFTIPLVGVDVPGAWTATQDFEPRDGSRVDVALNFAEANQGPSLAHPFGTDNFGRDLFTRNAKGGQVSIIIGFGATIAILVIGILYGAVSGFIGGKLDNGMMRFLDALYGLPYLPFAIITLQIVGTVNVWTMMVSLSIASWFTTARIVRGQIITLKGNDYVRAARAVGARWYRVLGRHLLPNTLGILVIAVFLELPTVVLGEAFLSFIGLGINPPEPSWGALAADGRDVYRTHPHVIAVPSIAIAILVLCANFIADGVRDALDPRTRET